jgi:hypothetical protein
MIYQWKKVLVAAALACAPWNAHAQDWGTIQQQQLATQLQLQQMQAETARQNMITEQQLNGVLAQTQQRLQQSMPGSGQRNCVNGWVVGAYMAPC